ncbi:nucleolar complex protein 3 [Dermacentor variabilis]|uniref:nucleolar complex protein 3 n=1 Tax=Dermacentor variabilis TaxID=34621 RepID=UPI003F5BC9B3
MDTQRRKQWRKGRLAKRRRTADDSDEHAFEKVPRRSMANDTPSVRVLLPVKTKHGVVQKTQVLARKDDWPLESDEAHGLSASEDDVEDQPETPPVAEESPEQETLSTAVKSLSEKYRQLQQVKQKIGSLASAIVEDPQDKVGHFKELVAFVRDGAPGISHIVQRLAALTLLEVFKDVVPGYAITVPTAHSTGPKQKLKKETRALISYEEALLRYYGQYVGCLRKILARHMKRLKSPQSAMRLRLSTTLAQVAARCVCGMLVAHPHFNLRGQLIELAVHCLGSADDKMSLTASQALRLLYRQDRLGESTLDAVKRTRALLKARGLQVHPRVLEPFLSLRLRQPKAADQGHNIDLKKVREGLRKMSRKEHRQHKRMRRLEAQLRETEAEESDIRKDRLQGQILQQLLWTYAHVLKQVPQRPELKPLLRPVFKGLSQYAHLVNLDFLEDILDALGTLLNLLGSRDAPCCLKAAFALLSGQGQALTVDPQQFYVALFRCLLESPPASARTLLLCWRLMVVNRCRSLSVYRLKALCKRFTTVCLNHAHSLGLTLSLGTLLRSEPRLQGLLEVADSQTIFRPLLGDPDHAGCAPLWELHMLRKHYDPSTAAIAKAVASVNRIPPMLASLDPVRVAGKRIDPLVAFPGCGPRANVQRRSAKDRINKRKQRPAKGALHNKDNK